MPVYSWLSYFLVALILVITHDALFSELSFYSEPSRSPASISRVEGSLITSSPVSSSPSPTAGEFSSSAAKIAKANLELLHEMFVVLFNREPQDRGEFGSWADTLNQGASLEGVYHGLIQAEEYKKLENLY